MRQQIFNDNLNEIKDLQKKLNEAKDSILLQLSVLCQQFNRSEYGSDNFGFPKSFDIDEDGYINAEDHYDRYITLSPQFLQDPDGYILKKNNERESIAKEEAEKEEAEERAEYERLREKYGAEK